MVHKQLLDVLGKHGLKSFESQGQSFDPNLHQAIQRIESDVEEDTVHQEFQKGLPSERKVDTTSDGKRGCSGSHR